MTSKRQILIIEYSSHYGYVVTLMDWLEKQGFFVTLTCTLKFAEMLHNDPRFSKIDANNYLIKTVETKQISNQFTPDFFRNYEQILIPTYDTIPYNAIKNLPAKKLIATIHNLLSCTNRIKIRYLKDLLYHENTFKISFLITWVYNFIYFCRPRYLQVKILKKRYLARVNKVCFIHQNSKKLYDEKYSFLDQSTHLISFDFLSRVSGRHKLECTNNELRLAMLGNIDFDRKNYDEIFDCLENSSAERLIYLSILGKFKDVTTKKRFTALTKKHSFQVDVYGGDNYASEAVVEQIVFDSHFLISNQPPVIRNSIFFERYGYSKASGIEFDCLKYETMCFRPAAVPARSGLETVSIEYNDMKHLSEILAHLDVQHRYTIRNRSSVSMKNTLSNELANIFT